MDAAITVALVGGGFGLLAAVITTVGAVIQNAQRRKYEKEDSESEDMKALKEGMKWILYDRIRWLGFSYVEAGVLDFEDGKILNQMHAVYHNDLGGNGDLDKLMKEVNSLPVRK